MIPVTETYVPLARMIRASGTYDRRPAPPPAGHDDAAPVSHPLLLAERDADGQLESSVRLPSYIHLGSVVGSVPRSLDTLAKGCFRGRKRPGRVFATG